MRHLNALSRPRLSYAAAIMVIAANSFTISFFPSMQVCSDSHTIITFFTPSHSRRAMILMSAFGFCVGPGTMIAVCVTAMSASRTILPPGDRGGFGADGVADGVDGVSGVLGAVTAPAALFPPDDGDAAVFPGGDVELSSTLPAGRPMPARGSPTE